MRQTVVIVVACCLTSGVIGNTSDADDERITVRFTVVVDRPLRDPPGRIVLDKGADVFGREIDDRSIVVDSVTRGLSDVFVWTSDDRRRNAQVDAKPQTRKMGLANGRYAPAALVASDGDRLDIYILDPILDNPNAPFLHVPVGSDVGVGRGESFRLTGFYDEPVAISSSVFPWLKSHIFVQQDTVCRVSNRFGVCYLPVNVGEDREEIECLLWHGRLGYLEIVAAPQDVTVVGRGRLVVSKARLRTDAALDVTVRVVPTRGRTIEDATQVED